jgi:glycerol-3-phosphate acyltransferase PlsY
MDVLSLAFVLLAYLFGSFSSAVVVCRLLNQPDPRSVGSGNPGATNVLRYGGKKAAIITLLLDVLKGLIPVLLAKIWLVSHLALGAVALAAFLGHLYPVFFKFKGGKGVATGFGALTGLSWLAGLSMLATWLAMAAIFRYSSLSALSAAALSPLYIWLFTASPAYTAFTAVLAVLLIWRHRSNIRNLLAGREDKIGSKD